MSNELTHLDKQGRADMVDVGDKPETDRIAVAGRATRRRYDGSVDYCQPGVRTV